MFLCAIVCVPCTQTQAIIMPVNAMKYAHNKSNLSVVIFISATISITIAVVACNHGCVV